MTWALGLSLHHFGASLALLLHTVACATCFCGSRGPCCGGSGGKENVGLPGCLSSLGTGASPAPCSLGAGVLARPVGRLDLW